MFARVPVRVRLTLFFALVMAVVLAGAGALVYQRMSKTLNDAVEENLFARADDVTALIRAREARGSALTAPAGKRLSDTEDTFAQVVTRHGTIIDATPGTRRARVLTAAELARAARSVQVLPERLVPGVEGKAKVLARPLETRRRHLVVVVGFSTKDREDTLRGLVRAFSIGGPLALLLASAAGYLLAANALRPVETMRRRAERIRGAALHERLPLSLADDELRRLGLTLNAMLARLELALERERSFVADASHELRTPLAILKAELELALRSGRSVDELRDALQSAAEETDRLTQLAEDLLVIARADQGQLPVSRQDVPVAEVLEGARRRFLARAEAAGRAIVIDAPEELVAPLDSLRVEQAIGNLLDNALRYGDGDIRIVAERHGDEIVLTVADGGAGFPDGFADQAFERFTRADSARSRGGAGLGLSIVRAIARAHGGDAAAEPSSTGAGASVRLTLPASA